jgi:hypothetical protein
MKKVYMTPMLSIDKVESESPMMAGSQEYDWGQSKQDFFDEEDMDDIENKKNLWDD